MVSALTHLRANMKRLRLEHGLTQQALAEKAGLEYKYTQKIESGRWPGLQLRTIEILARALNVEAWELLMPPSSRAIKTANKPKNRTALSRKETAD